MSHAPSPRKRRVEHDDEHTAGHERWLVTYADMVTLLMVLFIVMFAMSTVDEKKYQELADGLADGFGAASPIHGGGGDAVETDGVNAGQPMYDVLVKDLPDEQRANATAVLATADRLRNQREYDEARVEVEELLKIWREVEKALRERGLYDDVRVDVDERGLVLSLVSEHVIFEPNVAVLTERGKRVVDTIAPILDEISEPIEVDGHTNQEPVKPLYYPTDWELSLARAAYVLRRLDEHGGLPANRLRATGFGHTRPLVDPDQPGSQRVNKRVDIVVLSAASPETRARFREIYEEMT